MKKTIELKYTHTYYYANIVNNVLSNDLELIGFLSNFFETYDNLFLTPFQKESAFLMFIKSIVSDFFYEDMTTIDFQNYENYLINKSMWPYLYAETVFKQNNIEYSFQEFISTKSNYVLNFELIEEYHEEILISGYIQQWVELISEEVFHIMFLNRGKLKNFNLIVSNYISELQYEDLDENYLKYFKKQGVLKRTKIPEWAKKAIYFRDRGKCCFCHKDLSGIVSLLNVSNFDHIVPLKLGGLNDISNLQLSCEECNLSKGAFNMNTSILYEKWF